MTERKRRRLKLKDSKICKSVSEYDFAQRLDLFCCKKDTLINTADIINVNKMKSEELFI